MQAIPRSDHEKLKPVSECFQGVVGVRFTNEEQSVLFLPESGDVFACDTQDWLALRLKSSNETSQLRNTLVTLGVIELFTPS